MVYGQPAQVSANRSVKALKTLLPQLPVLVLGESGIQGARFLPWEKKDRGGRWTKLNLDLVSPFEHTLYLDADTLPRQGDIERGFQMLEDGWELVLAHSQHQEGELFWHINEIERQHTLESIGHVPVQLQCGVMFIRKCEAVHQLFALWRAEWERFKDQDQAALVRALYFNPVKTWLLGRPWNGGAMIEHRFGSARE